jgi:hypothetical protein
MTDKTNAPTAAPVYATSPSAGDLIAPLALEQVIPTPTPKKLARKQKNSRRMDARNASSRSEPDQSESAEDPALKPFEESVGRLWQDHAALVRNTRNQSKSRRKQLAVELSELKERLCQAGRSGRWKGFLKEYNIPRSTADRLVDQHRRSLPGNCPTGASTQAPPSDEEIRARVKTLAPKLRNFLVTSHAAELFTKELRALLVEPSGGG